MAHVESGHKLHKLNVDRRKYPIVAVGQLPLQNRRQTRACLRAFHTHGAEREQIAPRIRLFPLQDDYRIQFSFKYEFAFTLERH